MRELHSSQEGMQLLSSGSAAAARCAIESLVEIVDDDKARIRIVITCDPEWESSGYGVSAVLSATRDASYSEYAASWSESFGRRHVLTRREM